MPDHAYLADGTRAGIRPHRRVGGAAFVPLARPRPPFPHPWLTLPTTDEAYEGFIGQLGREGRRGFLVCVRETGALAGFININNIVRGAFQCGAIGYGAFPPTAGRGYMSEGLGLVLRQAFGPLGLHRIEVNIQPGNEASTALVQRHGFRLEGFSPDFLYIDGAWRDPAPLAITPDPLGGARGRGRGGGGPPRPGRGPPVRFRGCGPRTRRSTRPGGGPPACGRWGRGS